MENNIENKSIFEKFINKIDSFVYSFWFIFCSIIFCLSLFIKAMYNMADFPYFVLNSGIDILFLVLVSIFYLWIFKHRDTIEIKVKYWFLFVFFGVVGIIFIFLLPIKPFSDMQYVTEGALLFAKGDIEGIMSSEYLQYMTKNLKVAMFYGALAIFLPKSIFTFRVINVVIYLLIAYFSGQIFKNLGGKSPKIIFIYTASFIPLILYCNHIYFDMLTYLLCLISVFFYTKDKSKIKNIILTSLFLGLACCMRVLALIFVIAIIIDMFFNKKELKKKLITIFLFSLISLSIPKICDGVVQASFRVEDTVEDSIWTMFWMGINEQEFGMMHNEIHTGRKTFKEFYDLLISRDIEQNTKLFSRKIFWTWSQGTWQAQRYGFSWDAENVSDKFIYETPVTGFFLNNEQIFPRIINSLSRAQYMSMFFFMILGIWKMSKENKEKYRFLIYCCFGTFLVLIFYEMKSRYVMHCFIAMMVLFINGMDKFLNDISNKYNIQKC